MIRTIAAVSTVAGFTQACAAFIAIGMETTPGFTTTTNLFLALMVSGLAAAISGLHILTP